MLLLLPTAALSQTPSDSTLTDSIDRHVELGEVTVTSQRQLVKNDIDKLTYDVANDVDAKTNNVLEILKKVPMVSVDGQDNILVNGSSSYKIYKNGHPEPSFNGQSAKQILRGMPASSIKKIEVITDPGAKYDAEGTTTILNIVMKDNASLVGVSGWVQAGATTQGAVWPGFGITVHKGKWTVDNTIQYSYQSDDSNYSESDADYYFPVAGRRRHQHNVEKEHVNALYDALSASYEIDSLNLLSVSGTALLYKLGGYDDQREYINMNEAGDILNRYNRQGTLSDYNCFEGSGRADYQHKTRREGEVLTLSYMIAATHVRNDGRDKYSFPDGLERPFSYDGIENNNRENFIENTLQADYIRPIWKDHKIEIGSKYINRSNRSKASQNYFGSGDLPDSTYSDFNHLTQVAAAYLQYIYSGKRWSARAGLRYEYSYLRAKFHDGSQPGFHTSLNDWCPSASVMYKFDDANTLRFGYSTSINRPGISYLNPMRIESPAGGYYGNPDLGSNRVHHFEISFSHTGEKLNFRVNPYFNTSNGQIGSVITADGDKIWSTYGNVIHARRPAVNFYVQWKITKNTSLYTTHDVWYRYMKNPSLNLKLDGWGGSYYCYLSQDLGKKTYLMGYAGGAYGHWPSSVYAISGRYAYYGLSVQKSLVKDKLTLRLSWSNPFEHRYASGWKTVQGDYTSTSRGYYKRQNLQLSVTWTFGKLKAQVKKVDTTIENDDVVGGIKK